MALANYTDLITVAKSFTHRTDLDGEFPGLIALAEAEFNRRIRTREMEIRAVSTVDEQYFAQPQDFLELRNVQLNTTPQVSLRYLAPQDIDLQYGARVGKPEAFTFIADQFQLAPIPDGEYEIEIAYYQRIPSLSEAEPTNWLMTSYPDIYLAAVMAQVGWFIQDDNMRNAWTQKLEVSLNSLAAQDRKSRFGGPSMAVRAENVA